MLTIFFLIAVSLFLPPFWFVTIGYIIYLIATRKQRRDKIIMHEITQSIAQNRKRTLLEHLYFDSAKSFAVDHGATADDPSEDRLDMKLNIDGEDHRIILQRQENDETLLLVFPGENATNENTTKDQQRVLTSVSNIHHLVKDSA